MSMTREHIIDPPEAPEQLPLRMDYRDTPAHVRDAEQDAICHELNRLQRLPDDMLTAMLVGCAEELHSARWSFAALQSERSGSNWPWSI